MISMSNLISNAVTFYQENDINPWIILDEDKKKKIDELEKLIHQSSFIPDENEKNWITILPYFSEDFLIELKQTLIRESLRQLDSKHKNKV